MESADSLKKIFGCVTDAELGAIFNRGDKAVSAWRKKGLPAAIERRAHEIMRERGIPITHETHMTDSNAAGDQTDGVLVRAGELSPEMQEMMEILKGYPLIKAMVLKMAEMSEDDQFEYYKLVRDAARAGKPLP